MSNVRVALIQNGRVRARGAVSFLAPQLEPPSTPTLPFRRGHPDPSDAKIDPHMVARLSKGPGAPGNEKKGQRHTHTAHSTHTTHLAELARERLLVRHRGDRLGHEAARRLHEVLAVDEAGLEQRARRGRAARARDQRPGLGGVVRLLDARVERGGAAYAAGLPAACGGEQEMATMAHCFGWFDGCCPV